MSRVEGRNIVIFVAAVGALLAGGALLANYSGILRADAQEQPEVTCAVEGKVCTHAKAVTAAFPTVHASLDSAPAGGCCPVDKPAGCCEMPPSYCAEKPVGCCDEPPVGCCERPQGAGCCPAQAENATE